jgi:hypothetical protein
MDEKNAKEYVDGVIADKAEIDRLAKLSPLTYGRERKTAAAKLGIGVGALDQAVEQRRKELKREKSATPQQTTALDSDELKRTAAPIIESNNILDLFAKEFGKVIAGEAVNGKLLYLVATSRLFDKPMNAAIKGTSAGGKSEIRKRILGFFPPEDVVAFTSLSEKALIYYDGEFSHKILSMGEATATDEQTFQDYLLRELMSEGYIRYPTAQKVGNDIVTVTIEKQGPVAFLVTTTKNKMHPENETRMLSLEIDDSENQTKKVLDKVAQVHGLRDIVSVDYKPWQDFQRWLATGERRVVVPFATVMVELIPPVAVRLRRDVGQVICAIQAHALLHREQRSRDAAGQIVADIDHDYEVVRKLMNAILAEGSGVAVNPAITETINAVVKATADMTAAEGATAKDIAKFLKLDKSAARRRLLAACDDDYIVNLEQRKGMPGKYRAGGQKVETVNILPVAADLADKYSSSSPHTPLKSVPPCHREEKPLTDHQDNGGRPVADGKPGGTGGTPVANPLATVKSLDGNGESPPVARWQAFSGGYGEDNGTGAGDDLSIPLFLQRATAEELAAEGEPPGRMVANGFAISGSNGGNPEDRKPLEPGQLIARVWIREIRHPAIKSGPDDDLDDFTISGGNWR